MLSFLRNAIIVVWTFLLTVPMPWRVGLIALIAIIVGYYVLSRVLVLLLLPEFWITNRLRRWRLRPLPGTYAFDRLVEILIRILRVSVWLVLLLSILFVTAWHARPNLEDTILARWIDQSINWWYSLEKSVLAGQ